MADSNWRHNHKNFLTLTHFCFLGNYLTNSYSAQSLFNPRLRVRENQNISFDPVKKLWKFEIDGGGPLEWLQPFACEIRFSVFGRLAGKADTLRQIEPLTQRVAETYNRCSFIVIPFALFNFACPGNPIVVYGRKLVCDYLNTWNWAPRCYYVC